MATSAPRLSERVEQISYGKQREAENGTPQIQVMTDTVLEAPMHPRKQEKCFGDMSKNDHQQAARAEQLEKSGRGFFSNKQDSRTAEQHASWH